jgi:hypothetical protein
LLAKSAVHYFHLLRPVSNRKSSDMKSGIVGCTKISAKKLWFEPRFAVNTNILRLCHIVWCRKTQHGFGYHSLCSLA